MVDYYLKAKNILTAKDKFYISLGLDRISSILNEFNNPQNNIKVIHVAGTNGKGSVCTILNEILVQNGLKTGLYTSPHIIKYTERIKINNAPIDDESFYNLLIEIDSVCNKKQIHLTEFELLTTASFIWFERQKVDIAIIEVGLGGRLDATNIIEKPLLSIITSISLDHTDRLGDTIEKIAEEKAGIIKNGTPCIVAPNNKGIDTIKTIAKSKAVSVIIGDTDIKTEVINNKNYAYINQKKYEFSLFGKYQEENLSLVITAINTLKSNNIQIDEKAIVNGLKNVKHICRFERHGNIIIDGAHNPDGAKKLRATLDFIFPNTSITYVYASLKTKDYKSVLKNLLRKNDTIYFLDFKNDNAVTIKELETYTGQKHKVISTAKDILDISKNSKNPVVLTGSLYAIGSIYEDIIKNYPLG